MSFSALGLSQALIDAVKAAGYNEPTPVQLKAITPALQKQDLMVAAQTGTGKTASFALPILELLYGPNAEPANIKSKQVRVLVLTPTRELAAQVHESFNLYGHDLPLRCTSIYGGVGQNQQVRQLQNGLDVLVACPGRLLDLIQQDHIDLSAIEILVLDEADRMLDMGFIHDVKRILNLLPEKRQNLLYSATFSKDIIELTNRLLHNPVRIEVTPPNTTVELISQQYFRITAPYKRALLAHLITMGGKEQVLVFTRTKHGANRLAEYLNKNGLSASALHGNKSQNARTKALEQFKDGSIRVLVATDIAARGIDIDQLPFVVNYELPNVGEDYVHRIGRTGRAGRPGEAISLVAPSELRLLKSIEEMTGQQIPEGDYLGFDLNSVIAEVSRNSYNNNETPSKSRSKVRTPRNLRQRKHANGLENRNHGSRRPQQARAEQGNTERPQLPANRAPDEFYDDEIDNFGNSVDYVSPYQNKNGNKNRTSRGRSNQPTGKRQQTGYNNRRHRHDPALFASADPTPAYVAAERERNSAPLIIRKGERLPSLEQLEQLDARSNVKRERPALLGGNN